MGYSRKRLDLTGQRFGKLTVLAPAENIGSLTTWRCLCDGTCVEMLRAKTVRCNNTSGVPGVDWLAKKQRWRASICFKGKRYYLGSYTGFQDAVKARKAAEENLHDRFLREYAADANQRSMSPSPLSQAGEGLA